MPNNQIKLLDLSGILPYLKKNSKLSHIAKRSEPSTSIWAMDPSETRVKEAGGKKEAVFQFYFVRHSEWEGVGGGGRDNCLSSLEEISKLGLTILSSLICYKLQYFIHLPTKLFQIFNLYLLFQALHLRWKKTNQQIQLTTVLHFANLCISSNSLIDPFLLFFFHSSIIFPKACRIIAITNSLIVRSSHIEKMYS